MAGWLAWFGRWRGQGRRAAGEVDAADYGTAFGLEVFLANCAPRAEPEPSKAVAADAAADQTRITPSASKPLVSPLL